MNRAAFLARLRTGLSGLAQEDISELIALIAFDFIFLLPLLLIASFVLFGVGVLLIVVIFSGMTLFGETISSGLPVTDFIAQTLVSVGLISASIAGGAVILLALEASLKLLAGYARLHYRLVNQGEIHA